MPRESSSGQVSQWGVDLPRLAFPSVGQEASGNRPGVLSLPCTPITGATNNRSFAASVFNIWPFFVDRPLTVTKWYLRINSNTVGATSTVRAGIYNLNDFLEPGSLVQEFPLLSIATGATGENYTTLSAPLVLQPGRYAIAWAVSSSNLSFRAADSVETGFWSPGLSNTAPARFNGAANSAPIASPLPDPAPAITISVDAGSWGFPVALIWSYT